LEKQKSLNIQYEELFLENAFRMDLLVENKVVLEIKSVENLTNFHAAQLKIM
jgi:GxxExxY protein